MCELFAMSAREPANVEFSMEEFARHGGQTAPHKDGWGIAFYDDNDVRRIRDTSPSSESDWARFLRDHCLSSRLVISHVRKATEGGLGLSNTQPFMRELGGRAHVFAHNGHIPEICSHAGFSLGRWRPIGSTDSEYAFCALLDRLEPLWLSSAPPSIESRFSVVLQFARDIAPLGPANFLYADGELLFAHGHRRTQTNGAIKAPGLHFLMRECPSTNHSFETEGLTVRADRQRVALIASVPLTGDPWRAFGEGEVVTIKNGELLESVKSVA